MPAKTEPRILTDLPTSDGVLDFDKYSDYLSKVISNSPPRFTVGIFGDWGTGKTTLMQMIRARLTSDSDVATVWFNAWRYEREEDLAVIPLLRTIRISLEKTSKFGSLRKALEGAIKGIASATSIATGPTSTNIGEAISQAQEFGLFAPKADTLYYDALGYLEGALRDLRKENKNLRLVVFIDDLDRCSPEKALEVLESLKALLDIDGIVYVLGINESTIQSVVKQKYGQPSEEEASAYLKKMVQLSFQIPHWSESDMTAFVEHLIRNELPERKELLLHKRLIVNAAEWNPRESKRFINSVILASAVFDKPLNRTIVVQALTFREQWTWLLDALLTTHERSALLKEFERLIESNQFNLQTALSSPYERYLSKLAGDTSLQGFLRSGGLKVLAGIVDLEEYRRASELTTLARERISIAPSGQTYHGREEIRLAGQISDMKGKKSLFVRVTNPLGQQVMSFWSTPDKSGRINFPPIVAGGTKRWVDGEYTVGVGERQDRIMDFPCFRYEREHPTSEGPLPSQSS